MAALSSCHMLTFLYLAQKQSFVVDSYDDEAVGVMTKNERGKLVRVPGDAQAPHCLLRCECWSDAELVELHHHAHEECYHRQLGAHRGGSGARRCGMKGVLVDRLACCCRRGAIFANGRLCWVWPRHQLIVNSRKHR